MTKDQAIALTKEIEFDFKKKGLWFSVDYDYKPDLKMITFEASIKVDK